MEKRAKKSLSVNIWRERKKIKKNTKNNDARTRRFVNHFSNNQMFVVENDRLPPINTVPLHVWRNPYEKGFFFFEQKSIEKQHQPAEGEEWRREEKKDDKTGKKWSQLARIKFITTLFIIWLCAWMVKVNDTWCDDQATRKTHDKLPLKMDLFRKIGANVVVIFI